MNKSIEQMILEELMLEADEDELKQKARLIFGTLVDDEEAYNSIKYLFPSTEKLSDVDETAQERIAKLADDPNKIDQDDLEALLNTATTPGAPNYNSLDDLLNAASQQSQTDNQDDEQEQPQTNDQTQEPQVDEQDAQEQALLQKSVETYKRSLNDFLDEIEEVETAEKEDKMVEDLYRELLKLYNELKEPGRDERGARRVFQREGILREEVNKKGLKLRLAKILRQYKEIKKLLKEFIAVAKSGQFKRERLLKEFLKEVRLFAVYIKTAYKNLPDVQNESLITESQTPYEIFSSFIAELRTQQDAPFANKQVLLDRLKEIIVNMKKDILPLFYSVKPFISSGAYKDRDELLNYTEEFTNLYKRHIVNAVSDLRPFLNDDDQGEEFIEAVGDYKKALIDFRKEMLDLFGIQIGENNEPEVVDDNSSQEEPLSQQGSAETPTTQTSTSTPSTQTSDVSTGGQSQQTSDQASDQSQTADGDQSQTADGDQVDSDSVSQQPSQGEDNQEPTGFSPQRYSRGEGFTNQESETYNFLEKNQYGGQFILDYMNFGVWLQNYIKDEISERKITEDQDKQSQRDQREILILRLVNLAKDEGKVDFFQTTSPENLAKFIRRMEKKNLEDFDKYFPIDKAIDKLFEKEKKEDNKKLNRKKMRRLVDYRNLFVRIFKPEDFESELKKVFGDGLGQRFGTFLKGKVMESTDKNKKLNESLFIGSLGVLGLAFLTNKIQQRGAPKDIKKIISNMVYNQKGVYKEEPLYHTDKKDVYQIDDPKKFNLVKKTLDGFLELHNNFLKAEKEDVEGFISFLVNSFEKVNELLIKSNNAKPISGKSFIEIIRLLPNPDVKEKIDYALEFLNKAAKNSEKVEKIPKEGEYYFNDRVYGDDKYPGVIFKILEIKKGKGVYSDTNMVKVEKFSMVPDSDSEAYPPVRYYKDKNDSEGKHQLSNYFNDQYKKIEDPKIVEYDPPGRFQIYKYNGDDDLGEPKEAQAKRDEIKITKNEKYEVTEVRPGWILFQTKDDKKYHIQIKHEEWIKNKESFERVSADWDEMDSQEIFASGYSDDPNEEFTDEELTLSDEETTTSQNEQIERKLETIIEQFINKRKQQWRKRTM